MALLSVIRRWALRDQLSIREIARRTGLWRNTIRKYLRAGTVEPAFRLPDRPSKLDPSFVLAEDGSGQVPQEAANAEAAPCGPGRPGLRGLLQPGRGVRAEMERRSPEGGAERRPRHLHTAGLSAWGGLPVRLERGLGVDRRGEHEAPDRPYQAVAQPGVPAAGVSAADARDAVRRALARVSGVRRCPRAGGIRQYEDRGGPGRPRQGQAGQRAVPGDDLPLRLRARVLQPGGGPGERTGREERAGFPPPDPSADAGFP